MVRTGSAWRKNNLRELRKTLGRFLAIFSIVALGVGLFVGLKVARPAMVRICVDYLEESSFYDYQLVSSLGLTQEDSAWFAQMDGVVCAEGSVSLDLLTSRGGQQVVCKTHQILQEQNHLQLTAGRLPRAANECVADARYFTRNDIGSVLPVENPADDGDALHFSQNSYTIVGLCTSAQYLGMQRGSTSLGNGTAAAFLYLPREGYEADCFTELYLKLNIDADAFSDSYGDAIDTWEAPLTEALEHRVSLRQEEVISLAQEELDEAWQEYYDGLQEYEDARAEADQELADAKAELDDAALQLADAEAELADGAAELEQLRTYPLRNADYAAGRRELDAAWEEYNKANQEYLDAWTQFQEEKPKAEQEIADGLAALEANSDQLLAGQQQLDAYQAQLQAARQELDANWAAYEAAVAAGLLPPELAQQQKALLEKGEAEYAANAAALQAQQEELNRGFAAIDDGYRQLTAAQQELKDAEQQLLDARAELDDAYLELEKAEETFFSNYYKALADGEADLEEGREALADARQEYEDGLEAYWDAKSEAEREFSDAEAELADALVQLEDAENDLALLKNPYSFVLDRMANAGYSSFDNDTRIVDGIAKIFPVFFFLVAALVCSSTMTRMVEEQRTQNGTLKALGYSNFQIMWRYASYAGSAALLGSATGFFLCSWLFPTVIWFAYSILYQFADMRLLLDWQLGLLSTLCALLCSVGAACASAWTEMQRMPATLMRPKAPKAGKRIFLEYLTPLWKRLGFLHKVAARNIFRYKKRLFMMILGVAGCMALLISGFGLRDSISNIAEDQFGSITVYDYEISFSEHQTEDDRAVFLEQHTENLSACAFASTQTMDIHTATGTKSITVIATDDPQFGDLFRMKLEGTELGHPSDQGLFLSHKIADLAGVTVGDIVTLQKDSRTSVQIPVEGIFENYVFHYAILTQAGYEDFFGEEAACKTAYAATDSEDVSRISTVLQEYDDVVNVMVVQTLSDTVTDSLESIDAVVLLVIICAIALSFVVSYNLCNINITERVREIATIKVLGFYPKETHTYVFRESITLTAMGVAVGIPLGIWFHRFVLDQIQVDMVSFYVRINPPSYFAAVFLTFAIIMLVERILRKKIDSINMAESLKSVE